MTLEEIKDLQAKFDLTLNPDFSFYGNDIDENDINVLEHLLVCMVGEVGEFANHVKKIKRGDCTFLQKKNELEEELADVFIYLIKISNHLKVNLDESYLTKLEKNKVRFRDSRI